MKALVKFDKGIEGVELRDIPEPAAGKGELKVRVMAAGICGSDQHYVEDRIKLDLPVVLGHEYVGVVEETGEGVGRFKRGDWVVSMTAFSSCGTCIYCRSGQIMQCPERVGLGRNMNGTMAEYVLVNANNSFPVPAEVEDKLSLGALEAFSCATRCSAENTLIKPADLVVVSGPGTLGISAMMIAKLRGAYVIVHGLPQDQYRLQIAKKLGADAVTAQEEELRRLIKERNLYGADVVFESSGAEASMNLCIEIVRKQGTLAQIGVYGKKITVNFDRILDNEIKLTNSFGAAHSTWELALKLLKDRKINLSPLVTERVLLKDWKKAFELAGSKKAFKVLLIP